MGTIVCRAIFAVLLASFFFGCATLEPSRFTSENIALLHVGMTTTEVEKLFGPADSIRNTVCGREEKWQCEIWTYDDGSYRRSTFWFNAGDGRRLDQWDVTRAR
jgi:hypothetical protein